MARTVKHLSLHRIDAIELRVIADVDAGVLPIIEEEERVLRDFQLAAHWTQRMVSLFILADLQPLLSQVQAGGALPPGETTALADRTVINVYDLADPSTCNVFVNYQAMRKEGYWEDRVAIRGLLAHEHAHPLAENDTIRASRRLRLERYQPASPARTRGTPLSAELERRLTQILDDLARQVCLAAPREIFTNAIAITQGFAEAMLHLNQLNVRNAVRSLAGRDSMRQWLEQEVADGTRSAREAELLVLVGDLQSYLPLAMEVAPFARAGRTADAAVLEHTLTQELFPRLARPLAPIYRTLRAHYETLRADLSPLALRAWGQELLMLLTRVLREQALGVEYRLQIAAD